MNQKKIIVVFFIVVLWVVMLASSCDNNDVPSPGYGKLSFKFEQRINNKPIVYDTIQYVNAAGNRYMVDNIQYFVSDFKLWKEGEALLLDKGESIHYVDTDIPESWKFQPDDDVPAGKYDSISFVFGITGEKNQSFMFVNPPESFMFWPEHLGGGYHYMKLNGKWKTNEGAVKPFNFHLGIGQVYNGQGEITEFVQNWFNVSLPASAFLLESNQTKEMTIVMNVEKWFKEPNTWDFNVWGGKIMENQDAMHTAIENGHNVFSINTK